MFLHPSCKIIIQILEIMEINNKTALITGATSGIGYELAKLFARDKYNLVIVSRSEDRLNEAANEFWSLGSPRITVIPKDLSMSGSAKAVYEHTKREGIEVNVLVNDAGVGEHGLFSETEIDKELKIIQLNIVSLVHLTKLYLTDMLQRREGRILQLASVASYEPTPMLSVYAATKAFVLSFTDSLIHELKDTGVTMTALIPGPTDTDFFRKAHMEHTRAAQNDPQDPAEVAKVGYEGLMNGEHHAVVSASVRAQVAMSSVLPNETVTSMAAAQMEEKK
jgi:short-subunit dehydrogenase